MNTLSRHLIVALLLICNAITVYGQGNIVFEVLSADNSWVGNKRVETFDSFKYGDTITVMEGGFLSMISNYYHAVELSEDTIMAIPSFAEDFPQHGAIRPPLKRLFSDTRIITKANSGVEHDFQYIEFLWPDPWRHSFEENPCIQWRLLGYDDDEVVAYALSATDFFDEKTVVVDTVSGVITMYEFESNPDVVYLGKKEDFFAFRVEAIDDAGTSFEGATSGYSFDRETIQPITRVNPCKVSTATEAIALGLYFESNHGAFLSQTASFYTQATLLSTKPVFKDINQYFLLRNR